MPEDVRGRVMARIGAAAPRRDVAAALGWWGRWRSQWRFTATGFGAGVACAAALALLVLVPSQPSLVDAVVAGHIRALQPGHLEDVPSSDQHTVKPWFDGRIDFAPPVKDLAAERFPLRGGRLDYIGGRPVAALIYQHDKHLIDLFVWPAGTGTAQPPEIAARHGYNVVHWNDGGMALWAVSDLEANLLREFAEDWRGSP
jgi:anti-sigma factor RsiW